MSTRSGMGPERKTIDELLRESRARLDRLAAEDAHAAAHRGALLVDIRSERPSAGGLDRHVVLMCNEGYRSSLAAATLQTLGFARATDVVGGFQAWRDAGLPVVPARQVLSRNPGAGVSGDRR